MTALPCASLDRNCCKVAKSLIPVARRSITSSPSLEICDNVVVLAGEGVDKGVPAGASGQNIVAILAAEDIVAVAARQRVVEVAAEEPIVAGRARLVDGARGLAVDHVGGALRERAVRRSHDNVAVSVAVDVAGSGDRRPEMGGIIERLNDGCAIDPEAIGRAQVSEIDVAKSGRLAEDDIGRSRVLLSVWIGAGRPNDQVVEAVAVEIACGSNRVSGLVSGARHGCGSRRRARGWPDRHSTGRRPCRR